MAVAYLRNKVNVCFLPEGYDATSDSVPIPRPFEVPIEEL